MCSYMLNCCLLASLCLLLAVTADSMQKVQTITGQDCKLQCTANLKPGVQYRSVRWYKETKNTSTGLSGLLTRNFPNGTTRWYVGVEREVQLVGESLNILLPNVTCSDSGVYVCHLAASVGEQNRQGEVLLTVTDCPVESAENEVVADSYMVITAITMLIFALVIFSLSYNCLKNSLKGKNKMPVKEVLLDSPPKLLDKKDLMLIYTLGPKSSTAKHVYV